LRSPRFPWRREQEVQWTAMMKSRVQERNLLVQEDVQALETKELAGQWLSHAARELLVRSIRFVLASFYRETRMLKIRDRLSLSSTDSGQLTRPDGAQTQWFSNYQLALVTPGIWP
jgi:hypothetical protein